MRRLLFLLLLLPLGCQRLVPGDLPPPVPATQSKPAEDPVHEALAEVNAARAKRGLKPFQYDALLTEGARRLARYRAEHLIEGHLPNDFAMLPEGANATATGCAALEDSWGWQSCCAWEDWKYAGAEWARGSDGKRYMHLVVR